MSAYGLRAVFGVLLLWPVAARSTNLPCWKGLPGEEDRPEVTCRALTEKLLISIGGATTPEIAKIMGSPGEKIPNGLHYMSNYIDRDGAYSGDVNITIEDGRASIVEAMVEGDGHPDRKIDFIWNARLGWCSDFPGSKKRCNE